MPSVSSARPIWLAVRVDNRFGGSNLRGRTRAMRHVSEDFRAAFAADFDQKLVSIFVDEFGQGQIEARVDLWSSLH